MTTFKVQRASELLITDADNNTALVYTLECNNIYPRGEKKKTE